MANNATSDDDDYLAGLDPIDNTQCATAADPSNGDELEKSIGQAQKHELIKLTPVAETFRLEPGMAFHSKWKELNGAGNRSNLPTTTNEQRSQTATCAGDERIFVVSVIGDTACGSFLVNKLLDEHALSRPLVIDDRVRNGSTTGNILCYESTSFLPNSNDTKSLLLDFEGEQGSSVPKTLSRPFTLPNNNADEKRREAIERYFPTLAYTLSNVIILIGRDDFVSAKYIDRCVDFVRRATRELQQNRYKPVLILIENLYVGPKTISIRNVTGEFLKTHPKHATDKLEKYFERVFCLRLPRKSKQLPGNSSSCDGGDKFDGQITDLKILLANIQQAHGAQRCLSHLHWLMATKLVIQAVSRNKTVLMHMLLRQAIMKACGDVTETLVMYFFLKLYSKRDIHSMGWFQYCREFSMEILKHTIASRLLHKITATVNEIVPEIVIKEEIRECLEKLWERLESFRPCTALYMGQGRTATKDHPVFCYQHKEIHQQQHRTSEKVSGVPLFVILGLPFRRFWDIYDLWSGGFESNTTVPDEPSEETHRRFFEQTVSYWEAVGSPSNSVYTRFEKLLKGYGVQLNRKYLHYQGPCCFCLQKESSTSSQPDVQGIMICRECDSKRPSIVPNHQVQLANEPGSNENNCCICMNAPREVMFTDCNHFRFCKSCAEMIEMRYGKCPLCRKYIKGLIVSI